MQKPARKALVIPDAIESIHRDTLRLRQPEYEQSYKEQDLLAFRLLLIGEAANQIDPVTHAEHPEVPWRKIVSLRHLIAHAYDNIDPALLWVIANESLAPLAAACRAIIARYGEET